MSKVAIVAALPREIAPLVRGVAVDAKLLAEGIHLYRLPNAVVVTAGMGAERAAFAVEAALACGEVVELMSVGLAGSCSATVLPGAVLVATAVVDARTGERFDCADTQGGVLATTASIASVHEKARLESAYGAAFVDMEAATVARLARAHDVRLRVVKGISDAHDFELASLSRFATARGQFRTGRFALHTAVRPHRWRSTVRLGRTSASAVSALNSFLMKLLTDRS